MPKALCISGAVVAVLLVLLFGVDLAVGFPFARVSILMDAGAVLCAAILGFLGWTTLRQQRK
ncbi:MAG: hypothetical protein ABR915_10755 [Thermoguttaceae bacterium]|jgi:threonine/homoserine/homoserine lactone efflux protein